MAAQLDNEVVAVVLRGNFTPTIFQPSWFASHGLIRVQESDAAKVEIIHPTATIFTTEWLQLNVIQDRFHVTTTQASFYEPLRDLVIGVLKILNETPLKAMGINRAFHYRLGSEVTWHNIGNTLAPKKIWEPLLDKAGMRGLIMEGKRADGHEGYIQVKVEPSKTIKFGVDVEINDHYQLKSDEPSVTSTRRATEILSGCWTKSMERGLIIADKIADIGDQT